MSDVPELSEPVTGGGEPNAGGGGGEMPPLRTCHHCDALVPAGQFCGNCGAALIDEAGESTRTHSYAAAPGEHLRHVAVVSTLFPHLPRRHAHTFSQVLGAGVIVVIALAAGRLYAPATVVAAVLLPVLYLLYLYEVEIYESEPVLVLAVTFGAGMALGAAFTLVTEHFQSLDIGGHAYSWPIQAVLLPIIAELLMIAGPLLLLSRSRFDEALDGLTFGAASALGFTLATVLASLWHVLTGPLLGAGSSTDEILRLVRAGLLAAVVNASATGIVTATLWLRTHGRSRRRYPGLGRTLVAASAAVFAVQVGLGVAGYFIADLLPLVGVWALAAIALLLYLRTVIHHALLEEGAEHHIGPLGGCSECHRLVPTMTFCPSCGVARSATPKPVRDALAGASG